MFSEYTNAFKISGADFLNEKKFIIERMIKTKQTIEAYPILC